MDIKKLNREELEEKYSVLKEKFNLQVDELNMLKNTIEVKENQLLEAKHNIEKLQGIIENKSGKFERINQSIFIESLSILYSVVSKLIKEKRFIITKKNTVNTTKFKMIEANIFKQYIENEIENNTQFNTSKITEIWATFGLIDEQNHKIYFPFSYNGKTIRVARIKKAVIEEIKENILYDRSND